MKRDVLSGRCGFPALGIEGAAIATVLGTVISSIMSLTSIMKPNGFISIHYIIKNKILPDIRNFGSIIKVGYSVFFEQLLVRVGFVAIVIMVADKGNYAMAAHQEFDVVSFSIGDVFQAAAVALIGLSLGEDNPEPAKKYGATCQMLGGICSIVLSVVYFFGSKGLMSLFLKNRKLLKSVLK